MSGSTEIPGEVCQNRIFKKTGSMHGASVGRQYTETYGKQFIIGTEMQDIR